ncbi:uncharacterized protein LOC106180514 isoform X2 [Lingula anatina]|nr:uncharacterized protein LOC106180514 isoform X2 [Lingula anatina]|eukprot:XP_013419977.1 uncharacterized protein LOC106180514 isoform X2 [Lingula anatina]
MNRRTTMQNESTLSMRFMEFEYLRIRQKGAVRAIEEECTVVLFWNRGRVHAVGKSKHDSDGGLGRLTNLRARVHSKLSHVICSVEKPSMLNKIKKTYSQVIIRPIKNSPRHLEIIGDRIHMDAIVKKFLSSRNSALKTLKPDKPIGSASKQFSGEAIAQKNYEKQSLSRQPKAISKALYKATSPTAAYTPSLRQTASSSPIPIEKPSPLNKAINRSLIIKETAQNQMKTSPFVFYFNNGAELTFHRGDITKQRVDSIVNAANEELHHSGGVAKAIADAAGPSLREESAELRRAYGGRIPTGNVVTTGAGRLPCRYVLHAVGPHVRMPGYKDLLEETVKNIVVECGNLHLHSVAIPAISTGIYGVPKHEGAAAMKRALKRKVEQERNTLRQIRMVDTGQETISIYSKIFEQDDDFSDDMKVKQSTFGGAEATPLGWHDNGAGAVGYDTSTAKYSARKYDDEDSGVVYQRGALYQADDVYSSPLCDPTDQFETASRETHDTESAYDWGTDLSPFEDHEDEAVCPICMDTFTERQDLKRCGHSFCKECLSRALKIQNKCPICGDLLGEQRGNQPKGTMSVSYERESLPGYEGSDTIVIDYDFPSGKQKEEHPNPGEPYKGTRRRAFLPNNAEGREILKLLDRAFKAKLLFTIGRSVTTGQDNVVVWNDVHQKTSRTGGVSK